MSWLKALLNRPLPVSSARIRSAVLLAVAGGEAFLGLLAIHVFSHASQRGGAGVGVIDPLVVGLHGASWAAGGLAGAWIGLVGVRRWAATWSHGLFQVLVFGVSTPFQILTRDRAVSPDYGATLATALMLSVPTIMLAVAPVFHRRPKEKAAAVVAAADRQPLTPDLRIVLGAAALLWLAAGLVFGLLLATGWNKETGLDAPWKQVAGIPLVIYFVVPLLIAFFLIPTSKRARRAMAWVFPVLQVLSLEQFFVAYDFTAFLVALCVLPLHVLLFLSWFSVLRDKRAGEAVREIGTVARMIGRRVAKVF